MAALLSFFSDPKGFENTILHPIDTIENEFTAAKHFISHPIEDTKQIFKTEKTKVTKFTKHPIDTITGGVSNEFGDIKDAIEKIPTEIRKDVNYIGNQFDYFRTDLKKGATAVEQFVKKDIEPLAVDTYKLVSGLAKGMIWLVERPQLVVGGVGSYLAMRWLNELRDLTK
jgi:hypothetical protein